MRYESIWTRSRRHPSWNALAAASRLALIWLRRPLVSLPVVAPRWISHLISLIPHLLSARPLTFALSTWLLAMLTSTVLTATRVGDVALWLTAR